MTVTEQQLLPVASGGGGHARTPMPKRWTRSEFRLMGEVGLLPPDRRVELVDGEIYEMSPMGPAHANSTRRVMQLLERAFGEGYVVSSQLPLALGDALELCPDLVVSPGSLDDFDEEHPQTAVLIVEISDSTLPYDRSRKASLYARSGVPEYWIINLVDRRAEVYRNPVPKPQEAFGYGYDSVTHYQPEELLAPESAPEARITVDDLFPRARRKEGS